jgi:hypothetical protein
LRENARLRNFLTAAESPFFPMATTAPAFSTWTSENFPRRKTQKCHKLIFTSVSEMKSEFGRTSFPQLARRESMPDSGALPQEIVEAIAISNAKSIGEQPAILANLALANQIANTNLAQQNVIQNQQAMFNLQLATVAKCVELIAMINPSSPNATEQLQSYRSLMEMFNEQFSKMGGNAGAQQKPPG